MDASSKTELQFVFPVYRMIVGLVVFLSHYSQRFAKLLGSNPVLVLATLILLSHALHMYHSNFSHYTSASNTGGDWGGMAV